MDGKTEVFEQQRSRLLQLAYGFLGTRADAEDIVQDAYLRFAEADLRSIANPQAWLATVTTNLSLDRLRSAAKRREVYPGTWLPEPVLDSDDPEVRQIRNSQLTLATMVVLDGLTPQERAVFLLREVFEVGYGEIASILQKSEAAVRQVNSRARGRLEKIRERSPDVSVREAVVQEYARAITDGDEQALRRVLARDAVFFADSGGKVAANVNPIFGPDRIVRFLFGVRRKVGRLPELTPSLVNGEPGLIASFDGRLDTVLGFAFDGDQIREIYAIRNPDKLAQAASK